MKKLGYFIFAFFYYIYFFLPMKKNRIFCIMTHDSSETSNVGMVVRHLKKQKIYQFCYLKKEDKSKIKGKRGKLAAFFYFGDFFIKKPYQLATSECILQDNIFLPLAYIKFKKEVKVIQLWHGTGTIKRFGQDVNTGELKRLEYRANQTITHLIVNSEKMKSQYQTAFGVSYDKIYAYGLPRTDLFFQKEYQKKRTEILYKQYPMLSGKKVILYAPTFRDSEQLSPKITLNIPELLKNLPEQYILILKLHPHVAAEYKLAKEEIEWIVKRRLFHLSAYPDLSGILGITDYLITDYSSLVFEYCLREKPMIFYAYDYEKFEKKERGFYGEYSDIVPGPIVRKTSEIIELILKDEFDRDRIWAFKEKNYDYLDGKSTHRVVNIIKGK